MNITLSIASTLTTLAVLTMWLASIKPTHKPIRRSNGQVARKIPVREYGEIAGYIHL